LTRSAPSAEYPVALVQRLAARRGELEQEVLASVYGVSDPASVGDPQYTAGLREAVSLAIDFGIACLLDEDCSIPSHLVDQARAAARGGVSLDTIMRRYVSGYALLSDTIVDEASSLTGFELRDALRIQSSLLDRLLSAVAGAYDSETRRRLRDGEQRRAEQIKRLLAGKVIDTSGIRYGFDDWHLGVVATGSDAIAAIRGLAAALDRRLLLVRPDARTVWAWLGGRARLSSREALRLAELAHPEDACLAFGEPARSIDGWRRTHGQAKAAFPIAQRESPGVVRYTDVALLATAIRDEVLAGSLEELYLAPLASERDGGETLRQTLYAYFAAGRNVSSAAATLEVTRQTVNGRLRAVEERVGRPLADCAPELETALRLRELHAVPASTAA
jgi:PucR-like helix-turn-helix protein/diguanylate cyclase with GGDEF domain